EPPAAHALAARPSRRPVTSVTFTLAEGAHWPLAAGTMTTRMASAVRRGGETGRDP
ncbi:MAG: hypothetical protein QOI03_79, partial [Solirubrobacteraceae bacterium]|nr:hypothetical protein [Solirubrobacteraceae bacterium]